MSLVHNELCHGGRFNTFTALLAGRDRDGSVSVTQTWWWRMRHSCPGSSEAVGGRTPENVPCTVKDLASRLCSVLFCARKSELNPRVSVDVCLCNPCTHAAFYL